MKLFSVKRLDFLVSLYIFCILVSELMGGKTVPLATIGTFHLTGSTALLLLPLVYTINDAITEVYGAERTRSIVRSGLIMVFLLIVFSLIAVPLPPSMRFAPMEKAYDTVFGVSTRIAAASLTAFALAEFTDVFIFHRLRKKMGKRALWFRNNVSNFISEFIDTAIFMTLAFYALNKPLGDNMAFLLGLILPYWLLKCALSVIETPLVYLCVNWLKNSKEE